MYRLMFLLIVLLAACAAPTPAVPPGTTPQPPAAAPTVIPSPTPGPLPTATTSPAPTTAAAVVSPAELKYQLIGKFGPIFFCDSDFYPVARPGAEQTNAEQQFPTIQANTDEYQAILRHNNLKESDTSAETKLLIYREHKKLNAIIFEPSGSAFKFQLQTGQAPRSNSQVEGTISGGGTIAVTQQLSVAGGCPICLSGNTLIATPGGPVAVKDLRPGMVVWTVDAVGARQAATVLETVRRPVPLIHEMVYLALADGREIVAAGAHPTTDGRLFADLKPGDLVDGSRVVKAERVRYEEDATYDLLPSGETGAYWANGILIGSTLRHSD
ncbi:MAG: hypothetical protein HY259_01350 [Chloroflexi bacterium]|nr:hypothetical protein [Chloroflexota bacterium]